MGIPVSVAPARLAAILGVGARRIRQLAEDGVLQKVDGFYDLDDSVKRFLAHRGPDVRDEATRRVRDAAIMEAEEKAKLREIVRKEREGKLISLDVVREEWSRIVREMKQTLENMPRRITSRIGKGSPEMRRLLEREVDQALTELSQRPFYKSKR